MWLIRYESSPKNRIIKLCAARWQNCIQKAKNDEKAFLGTNEISTTANCNLRLHIFKCTVQSLVWYRNRTTDATKDFLLTSRHLLPVSRKNSCLRRVCRLCTTSVHSFISSCIHKQQNYVKTASTMVLGQFLCKFALLIVFISLIS